MFSGTLVGWLGDNLRELAPCKTVREYQQGAKFTLGRTGGWREWWAHRQGREVTAKPMGTGWHWYCPILQSIEVLDVVADVVDLKVQHLTTTDGKPVALSMCVEYEIADAVQYHLGIQQLETNFEAMARTVVARRVRGWSWDELHAQQKELEVEVRDTLRRRAVRYGVKVLEVGLTDIGQARILRHLLMTE